VKMVKEMTLSLIKKFQNNKEH